jgi:chromosome segregation ATPase
MPEERKMTTREAVELLAPMAVSLRAFQRLEDVLLAAQTAEASGAESDARLTKTQKDIEANEKHLAEIEAEIEKEKERRKRDMSQLQADWEEKNKQLEENWTKRGATLQQNYDQTVARYDKMIKEKTDQLNGLRAQEEEAQESLKAIQQELSSFRQKMRALG